MRQIYKTELKRAFLNRRMVAALACGGMICAVHFVRWLPMALEELELTGTHTVQSFYPANAFAEWICSNQFNPEQYIYFLIFPLLAGIPYGTSLFEDWRKGYAKNIILRSGKRDYFRAKWMSVFLSGGTAVVLPLLMNFLAFLLFVPANRPEIASLFHSVGGANVLASLFYKKPFLYLFLYLGIDFMYGGILAGLGLIMTNMTDRRFVVEMTPLFVYIFVYALTGLMNQRGYCPVFFLNMDNSEPHFLFMAGVAMGMFLLVTLYAEYAGRKGEIY